MKDRSIIEIVVDYSSYCGMQDSILSKNKIIVFDSIFSIADLSTISEYKISLPEKIYKENRIYSFESSITQLKEAINKNNKIRIWTSHKEINSYLLFLYLCNYLENIECDLYVLYSDEYKDECYAPSCMNKNELEDLQKLEHKISSEEKILHSKEWKEIERINSEIRIIDNSKIESISFNYFTDIILDILKEQKEISDWKIINILMKKYYLEDRIFIYLINKLIKEKKIKVVKTNEKVVKFEEKEIGNYTERILKIT